ncbi:glycoside hydrolase family protein [Cohnella ginsengisoli]|uniref:Glycoside hydrolase family protein n=1 Tax=Cohnella ginsengisoli TaxID=425004 RepID=A0A9X4KJ78_9BACL|nr:glycoside hydrolase family protein [Cohnella ginsengisoli]MDG0791192.1 glycoside hydrolase family protein [Cohnella ginsengisoli]
MTFRSRLLPMPKDGGFRMDGYYIWCGSVVKAEDGHYHMFASRWPVETGFPDGYRTHSEIVRAIAEKPEGPYTFVEVVLRGRGGGHWDAQMVHNPAIVRHGNQYILYYLGARSPATETRAIGYAYSRSIEGPWVRTSDSLTLMPDSNNPAPWIGPDGRVLLAFRHGPYMRIGMAEAEAFNGAYRVVQEDLVPGKKLEDPFLFSRGGRFEMILEDNGGSVSGYERYGVHLVSDDGLTGWRPHESVIAYDHSLVREDGVITLADRRERPQLLFDEYGGATHLFTGVRVGEETWNAVQPLLVD